MAAKGAAPEASDDFLDASGVAQLLGLGTNTAYRMIADGTLAGSGQPRLLRRADVVEYIRRCRIQPGQLRHLNQYARTAEQVTPAAPGP